VTNIIKHFRKKRKITMREFFQIFFHWNQRWRNSSFKQIIESNQWKKLITKNRNGQAENSLSKISMSKIIVFKGSLFTPNLKNKQEIYSNVDGMSPKTKIHRWKNWKSASFSNFYSTDMIDWQIKPHVNFFRTNLLQDWF
jgi:hypothetical protein